MGTGWTTFPASLDAGAGVASEAAPGEDGVAAAATADTVAADAVAAEAGACLTHGAEMGGERLSSVGAADGGDDPAAAMTAVAGAVGAAGRNCGSEEDGPIREGVGPLAAVRCGRAPDLRPFACMSNCRAASRVRQYPAA
jgi:hypothetical protein